VVCDGSCSECPRCLRLYICDAVDCGGLSAWKTWLSSRIALQTSTARSEFETRLCGRGRLLVCLYTDWRADFKTNGIQFHVFLCRPTSQRGRDLSSNFFNNKNIQKSVDW